MPWPLSWTIFFKIFHQNKTSRGLEKHWKDLLKLHLGGAKNHLGGPNFRRLIPPTFEAFTGHKWHKSTKTTYHNLRKKDLLGTTTQNASETIGHVQRGRNRQFTTPLSTAKGRTIAKTRIFTHSYLRLSSLPGQNWGHFQLQDHLNFEVDALGTLYTKRYDDWATQRGVTADLSYTPLQPQVDPVQNWLQSSWTKTCKIDI